MLHLPFPRENGNLRLLGRATPAWREFSPDVQTFWVKEFNRQLADVLKKCA